MKRKWLAALSLLMAAALLSGCTAQQPTTQTFAEVTQYLGVAPTATPVPEDQPADDGLGGAERESALLPIVVPVVDAHHRSGLVPAFAPARRAITGLLPLGPWRRSGG